MKRIIHKTYYNWGGAVWTKTKCNEVVVKKEEISREWKNVTCKKCLKLKRPKKRKIRKIRKMMEGQKSLF